MECDIKPVTLEGQYVRLEPLAEHHAPGLFAVGQTAEDWTFLPRACFASEADCAAWVAEALATPDHQAFAIVERGGNRPVGSSRYLSIRPQHRGLEIGWTWLGREYQQTPVNTEAKLLLLTHAFETLGAIRVEFKTDERNTRSQAALRRIGARSEGVLRQHMVVQNGYLRNSVYFSILDTEWPLVKAGLEEKLAT